MKRLDTVCRAIHRREVQAELQKTSWRGFATRAQWRTDIGRQTPSFSV